MSTYSGGCYCGQLRYEIKLNSPDDARTSLCHCKNCKKFTGGPFGVTTKIPLSSFTLTQGEVTKHAADNGTGSQLHREFCGRCGGPVLEYGEAAAKDFRYIFHGTLDDPNELPPKGEFFCEKRCTWMPEIEGLFHKKQIKE